MEKYLNYEGLLEFKGNLDSVLDPLKNKLDNIEEGATANEGTVTAISVDGADYIPINGVVSLPNYPTTLPASDVSSWAKAQVKPSYSASEVGLDKVGNFKAVSTEASQGLTSTEQANARANIGAGTSSFSGSYNDLSNKPTLFSGSYNDLSNKPTIPSLSGYATENWVSGKINDLVGIDASGVEALKTALSDNDTTTGLLTAIAGKVDKNGTDRLMTAAEGTKLSNIESGALAHKAPTTAEVKSALGTGSGTSKYLREDGTWVTPPNDNTTYQFSQSGNTLLMGTNGGSKSNIYTPSIPVSSVAGKTGAVTLDKNDVGLGNVGNFKAVSTVASQGLSSTEQSNARANIGAGTSSLTLGTGASNAYYGDKGKIAYDHSQSTHARTDATKVEASNTNGNIKINGTETTVYTHPGSGTNPHGTTKSDVGLGNVGNFKAVSTVASQGLSNTEKSNARANIGAGTGTITGIKMNGASKGSSGVVDLGTVITAHQDISGKVDKTTTVNGHELSGNVTVTKSDVGLGNVTNDAQVKRTEMGVASGVATLDSAGKVPSSQLPSYVDDVLEYDTKSAFPETGEAGKIYVDKSTNTTWRWSGTAYTQIKGDLVIGTTTGTAADGGVANTHYNNTSNPHGVTKAQVGLGSVVNTGDSATPVSGGTTKFTTGGAYTELNKKVDKVSGKGLSTNDYTTNEKNKLSGIASGAQVNVIETVKVNGTALTPSSKAVNVTVPTKTSNLTNDSNFVSDTSYVHTDNNYTTTEKNKLSGIASGAEVNQNAFSNVGVKVGNTTTTVAADAKTDTVTLIQGSNITLTPDATNDTITIASTNTKNTAGSTDSSSKLFLIGATEQSANPQTYSQDTAYVGTDGCLYSGGSKVATNSQVSAFGSNGIIDTHGEGTRSIILDSGNDLFAFYDRGGSCTAYEVETSTTLTNATLTKTSTTVATLSAELFNGFIGYNQSSGVYSGEKFAVYDLILPWTFPWGSTFYWSFGASSWKPAKMRILIAKDSGDYIQKYTSDNCPVFGKADISNGGTGYNRIRIVMSKYSRLSLLGVRNYNYAGQRTTFMNRTVDDYVYRSITPAKNSNWSLGGSGNYWKDLYITNINGVAVGSSPKFTDTTYSSKSAASGGTDVSLVTTGEKYTWNNKSNFSGSYNDLSNKPTIPAAANNGTFSIKTKVGTANAVTAADFTANQSTADDITLIQGNNVTLTTDTTNRTVTIAATDTTYSAATTSAAGLMSATDKSKLDGIASGATANTGTITGIKMNGASKGTSGVVDLGTVITAHQNISGKVNTSTTVNGHALTGNVTVTKSDVGLGNVTNDSLVKRSEMGVASGVATLDSNGKVPSSQLPSYVDDVIEAYYKAADGKFYTTLSSGTYSGTITGETGKIYVDLSTGRTYRWGGSAYAEIKASPGTLDDITDGSTYVRMTSAERTKLSGIATGATANTGTIIKVGNTSSGAVTVSSSNNTASFGNAVTVGSVGGIDLKFTMPGNPNTNTWRPIQVGGTDKLTDSSTKLNFAGSGATSVSYSNGTVTISSTDNNTVTSINGKTGAIAAADIATVLTGAGYKLTDANTWKAATTSQEGYVPTLALSGTSSGAKKNTINTQASDYVLTYTNGTETAPVWRKLPANAYANSTYTVNNGTFTVKGAGTAVSSTSANASGNTAVDFVAGSNVTITPDATNKKITIAATDTTYGVVSTSANGLVPKVTDTSKFLKGDGTWATPTDTNNRRSFYGTCDTAAATAAKAVTLSDTSGWELKAGIIVGIKFTNTNSASNVTLDVNSSGAKSIWYNNAAYTGNANTICGYASRVTYYMYDGTYWVWLNMGCLDGNTDNKVAQTVTTTSANYEVLFSNTADNTTRTEGARKNSNLKFNPSTGNLQATQLNGVTIGSSPKFTDTTYSSKSAASGGTDVSLVTTGEKYTWNSKTSNTGTVTKVTAGTGLTGGDITTTGTIALATSGVTAGTYKRVTVDAYGRVTSGDNTDSDTKNTAGTTNKTGTKMFLAAATGQSANPVTYSNSNCYIGTDNCLYSGGAKVLTSYTNTTYAAGTGVTISGSNNAINVTYGTTANTACQGNDSRLSNARPASDVSAWAKAASKPSYGYSEIGYTVNAITSAGGTLSLDGTVPLHVVTLTGNVSALLLSTNPPAGHSCHVILTASSEYTVAIAHDSTNRICPEAEDVSLTVKANGYVEIDFLNANGKIYVRGV